jgi:hypothetical protein
LYDVEQPFEWMELISISGKTNFFEKRVGDYQKAFVMQDEAQREFSLDGDFWALDQILCSKRKKIQQTRRKMDNDDTCKSLLGEFDEAFLIERFHALSNWVQVPGKWNTLLSMFV